MTVLKFRDLTENEIEVRIGQITDKGVTLLLYKNARVDMDILDETVGALNWQREHYECKGNLFCRVGINVNYDNEEITDFIFKSDCGTESYTEKEKGEASDSFKRACVNWGIGKELYTSPFIYIFASGQDRKPNYNVYTKKDGKPATNDKFIVEKIKIENKKITGLAIVNKSLNKRVFVWQAEN